LKQLIRSTTTTKQCPMCRFELNEFDMDTASVNRVLRKECREKYPEIYASRKKEHKEDMEDEKNKYVKKLIVGNDCENASKDSTDGQWKKWTFYVLMEENGDNIGDFVEKIEVNLHPTFNPSKLTFLKPPFEIVRSGWGTFEINFTVYFAEKTKKRPVDLSWYLSFRDGGRQRTFDLEFDKRHLEECGLLPSDGVNNNDNMDEVVNNNNNTD